MAADVVMPRLSDSMEEGTVLRWLKSVGDEVKRGDELVEIETDKANMTYEATDEGVLIEIVAQEGDTLPIGEVIARIGEPGEAGGDGRPAAEGAGRGPAEPRAPEPSGTRAGSAQATAPTRPEPRPPAGRRRRARQGVADRAADGARAERGARSHRGLRPRRADREGGRRGGRRRRTPAPPRRPAERGPRPAPTAAAAPRRPRRAKGEVQVVELNRLQPTVARRMAESKATVPHFYLETEIDMAEAVQVRDAAQGARRRTSRRRPSTTWS